MEPWIVHESCNEKDANVIMGAWPLIKIINEKFPKDCIFADLERIHLLFDGKGMPIMDRFDTDNKFWTADNPLPVNSIADDNEVLELWKNPIFRPREALFRQNQDNIRWMMKIRDKYPDKITLVITQSIENVKAWNSMDELAIRMQGFTNKIGGPDLVPEKKDIPTPVIVCYMIQTFGKASSIVVLATEPNMKYGWYCRHCAKCFPNKRCPKCVPTKEDNDTISKIGTYYCDAECQKADWSRHKKVCV